MWFYATNGKSEVWVHQGEAWCSPDRGSLERELMCLYTFLTWWKAKLHMVRCKCIDALMWLWVVLPHDQCRDISMWFWVVLPHDQCRDILMWLWDVFPHDQCRAFWFDWGMCSHIIIYKCRDALMWLWVLLPHDQCRAIMIWLRDVFPHDQM